MTDPALQTAALSSLEFVINKALELDPGSTARLAEMQGITLKIECTNPALCAYVQPGEQGLQLRSWYDVEPDSGISGTLSELTRLLQAQDKASALVNGAFQISGDSGPLLQLQEILAQLEIDWEQPIARLLGDVAGHQVGKFIRGSLAWGRHASGSLQRNVEEFIHEEARLLPPRLELENFYTDVGALNLRVDRLAARVRKAQRQLNPEPE
ncbi:MAG: ubiquinone biosynthesis accessory factor UbiJ [Pseudomonadales bacterium]